MAEINDLNVTDASNTARMPENQAPSTVNDGARALEGILARGLKDTIDTNLTGAGTANAQTVSANRTISAYYAGLTITFKAGATNTGSCTLNVDSVSADTIKTPNGATLEAGDITSGGYYTVVHDGTSTWYLISAIPPYRLLSGTVAVATSGTTVDFTGIPSWAKKITITFFSVSTSGTSNKLLQLGDSGGIETTGYSSGAVALSVSATAAANSSAGIILTGSSADAHVLHGVITLALVDAATFEWAASGSFGQSDAAVVQSFGGSKALSAALDRIRITTVNGTDTFDAGNINILYE